MALDSKGGRAELSQLLADQDATVQAMAQSVATETARLINAGMPASQAVSQAMAAANVASTLQGAMGSAVVQSLCVGAGIWPQVVAGKVDLSPAISTAMHSTWDDSGITLSSRIYGTEQAFKGELIEALQAHVQAKENAWNTARKIYDGYGFGGQIHQDELPSLLKDLEDLLHQARAVVTPEDFAKLQADAKRLQVYADRLATQPLRSAYKTFAKAVEKGLTKGLDKLVQTAAEEKARYHASRILRTETARAWGQGFFEQARNTTRCIGVRWSTSSAHKIFDVCDFCARADLFGMGPGIYPKDRCPAFPAHPHCFCALTMVFRSQCPEPVPQVGAGGRRFLADLPDGKRERLLTRRGEQAFRAGKDWEGELRNWNGIDHHALSSGASSVLREIKNSGVIKWEPPLEIDKSALTPLERKAIFDYTETGYINLNEALRSGSKDREILDQVAMLNSATAKMPQVSGVELFRGIPGGIKEVTQILKESPEGSVVTWKGFTSTTPDRDFADYHRDHGGIMVRIQNASGADISSISAKPNEREVLIPSGKHFRIIRSLRNDDGSRTLIVWQL